MNTRSTLLHKELQSIQIGNNTLQYRHGCGILFTDNGKETQDGDLYARNGRILYTRAVIRDPYDCRGLGYSPSANQETTRLQSGWLLENQQSRVSRVYGKEEKYPSRRPEINKAGTYRHMTTNKLTAVNSPLTAWNPHRSEPYNLLPISSIQQTLSICKVCYTRVVGMHRKEVYP
jgi:hypothetical protein